MSTTLNYSTSLIALAFDESLPPTEVFDRLKSRDCGIHLCMSTTGAILGMKSFFTLRLS